MKTLKFFKKKNKGNVGDIIGSMICFLFMLVILTVVLNTTKLLSLKTDIDRVARNAMLILETKGDLSDAEITDIENTLKGIGFENVTVNVNEGHIGKVNYGEDVTIEIKADTSGRLLHLYSSIFGNWDKEYDYAVRYKSISKASASN